MKRFLFVFLCMTLFYADGFAGGKCDFGPSGTCAVDYDGNDWFWFCTASGRGDCAGRKNCCGNKTFTPGSDYKNPSYICSKPYICCGDKLTEVKIKEEEVTLTSSSGNRTCKYTKQTDPCGKEISTPCSVDCPDGQVEHPFTGECVTPCSGGKVFESEMSTRCIECPITAHSGPVRVVNADKEYVGAYCKICNGTSQIFDSREPEETLGTPSNLCVNITDSKLESWGTKTSMSECALCPGDLFEDCVDCVKKNSCTQNIKQKCRLK